VAALHPKSHTFGAPLNDLQFTQLRLKTL